ncbi:hypothetical protein DM01DRAFT_1320069 [Hesseltinella vesiculosa]|uniref:Elongator complex protein 6 n=1 Tax=Hesseltinella vesiculosa TaxID=101127 RepID=A0A1X2GLX7_9FUNG|nr:hypothetical protein DM01DRAFT_1320069 [Hesseltinella vesiculosa]
MGYDTLNAVLAFPDNIAPSQTHLVITDTLNANGNFLLHHFISNHLKADRRVVLIGLSQIYNHYFLINRKLGMNLLPYKQSGQFVFLDGTTHLNDYSLDTPYPPLNTPSTPSDTLDGSKEKTDACLQRFYQTIRQHIQPGTLLILDDASALLMNGFGVRPVTLFLQKLSGLMQTVEGTLIDLIHADEQGVEDVEQDGFVKSVLQLSDLVLQVQALGSGFARDVHGQLSILYGPKFLPGTCSTQPQSMHYKIMDNNVTFFPKGVSQGVL